MFLLQIFLSAHSWVMKKPRCSLNAVQCTVSRVTRPTLLRLLDIYIHHRKILNENYNDLFMNDTFALERDVSTDVNYSVEEICRNEYEAFSYMVTRHPLNFFLRMYER